MEKMKVVILGSGNIGTDLLMKSVRSPLLECRAFIGRRSDSPNLVRARALGIATSDEGISYIERHPDCCDVVFDATSAEDHLRHAEILARLNKLAIDLTPAQIGTMCVPAINLKECAGQGNVSLITCGGQASIPLVFALGKVHQDIEAIHMISSVSSRSVGPATRRNIDEYIFTTEKAIRMFSRCDSVKCMLNINPAEPPIIMQTTVMARIARPRLDELNSLLDVMVGEVRKYLPGYGLLLRPAMSRGFVAMTVQVQGNGDFLPSYAGNLDIMSSAAIRIAEEFARRSSLKVAA